jgi:outer membrane protein OmpA-like peptidoglycan-associated protein
MKRPYITLGLVLVATLLPPIIGDAAPSRVQGVMRRAAETQPRYVPKAPDGVDEFTMASELKPIYFGFDKAEVRPADARAVDASAAWLKANPTYPILIAGHADPRGTPQYNLVLGERRATALRDELVARGVRADRIALVTYGEGMPACRANGEPCWSTDRAAVILVRRGAPQTP